MHRTEMSTKLITGFRGARVRPIQLLGMLGLVVVMAASCASDSQTTASDDTGADEQSSVTTTAPEVETTTTAEPEPEPEIEDQANPAPDADIVAFTEAFGVADSDVAWSYLSTRCRANSDEVHPGFAEVVDSWAAKYPGATAVNVVADFADGDTAAISYDVLDGSGEFAEAYISQPWIFADGNWVRDHC